MPSGVPTWEFVATTIGNACGIAYGMPIGPLTDPPTPILLTLFGYPMTLIVAHMMAATVIISMNAFIIAFRLRATSLVVSNVHCGYSMTIATLELLHLVVSNGRL